MRTLLLVLVLVGISTSSMAMPARPHDVISTFMKSTLFVTLIEREKAGWYDFVDVRTVSRVVENENVKACLVAVHYSRSASILRVTLGNAQMDNWRDFYFATPSSPLHLIPCGR